MKKILFMANWGTDESKAWSGTIPGVYKELAKRVQVERLNISIRKFPLVLLRCLEKAHLGRFDETYMKYYDKIFKAKYSKGGRPILLQFDESPSYEWADSYIFQDLSVGFLLDVYTNRPELIPYCGFSGFSVKKLSSRAKTQREYYQNAAGIFTMGQWVADYIVENDHISRDKVHAVGGGINVDPARINLTEKTGNKFLFIGRDFKRKGGDLVVQAFRLLKQENPELELYIAGPKNNPLDEKENNSGIYFLGEQSSEQVIELYNKCDVFCMPSRFEAYGLVFAEALTYGLPCIARNAFAMREIIQDGESGYLIEDDDISSLANKMKQAIQNLDMQKKVQSKQQYYIQKYSWNAVADRMLRVMMHDNDV